MKLALGLGGVILAIGIALGTAIGPGFFVLAAAGVVWLGLVGLMELRRATRLAMRPVEKENLLHRPPLAPFLPYASQPDAEAPRGKPKGPSPRSDGAP